MRKITLPRAQMMAEARRAKAAGQTVKIFEQEHPHTGRILKIVPAVSEHVILIMR